MTTKYAYNLPKNSPTMSESSSTTLSAKIDNAKIAKKSTGKRKFHKKSRKGCLTCKKRRVKCDEARSICGNCERMGIQCIYLEPELEGDETCHSSTNPNTRSSLAFSSLASSSQLNHNNVNQMNSIDQQLQNQQPQQDEKVDLTKIRSPSTPITTNATLSSVNAQPISPISQFLQQLPQSPIATAAASQFLNNFPPDVQVKLFQQFQQLPVDKQQQLYQSLPMSIKPSSESLTMSDDGLLSGLSKASGSVGGSFSDILGDIVPNRNAFMKQSIQNNSKTPTPQELAAQYQQRSNATKDISMNSETGGPSLSPDSIRSSLPPISNGQPTATGSSSDLNMLDLRLMYHYTTKVWPTITAAGISDSKIWSDDIPMLAFKYPFLMHSVLAFSATHLSRTERGLDQCVTCHRAEALRLLRDAVLEMSPENTDALVASALILIMDSLANASLPTSSSIKSLPPSAWVFHVKGAATILTAVWPLSEKSRFYKFISVDLGDLGEIGYDLISGELSNTSDSNENSRSSSMSMDIRRKRNTSGLTHDDNDSNMGNDEDDNEEYHNNRRHKIRGTSTPDLSTLASMAAKTCAKSKKPRFSSIECFDDEISDMFPISLNSPYFPTLAYMAKLHKEINKSDFILRIFAFPALLDKRFLGLLINCDLSAMRIMRCYYKLLRNFTEEMKEKVWFLEGVSSVLPVDVEQYAGGGGMHMMLDFLGGPSTIDDDGNGENYVAKSAAQSGLLDTNNLPSASMTDSLGLDDTSGLNNDEDNDT
ncbi:hypothetical protein C6P40_005343 [Pichia californica]|uniref:Zn(2)-C6 fungal-type domain-containing protein n=1 Tax=Pichia californica TaxID=460514 RepID=A0A9P6WLS9_9ASCO|nr:hypothetical protein C6P42_000137 [[Candida] californica]KAG0689249.1 hypothetical protein C6P40_005343 [[Candida] californica]